MRGLAAAARACSAASRSLLSLQPLHRSAHVFVLFRRIVVKPRSSSIRASFTSAGSGLLMVHRALSSQAEQFSLGWTGDQTQSAGEISGANLRLQAQQV